MTSMSAIYAILLGGPVRRRVRSAIGTVGALYLEDGRPLDT